MGADKDVLIRVEHVSKRFCRDLQKSLWYGVKDIAQELNPFVRNGNGPALSPQQRQNELRDEEFWAVNDVSFELRRGECLGLIGRNGAGKTTLLKMLNGLIKPDSGRIEMKGRVGALIALGAGFNPILSGRENIYINGSVLGLTKMEIDARVEEIIDFSGIDDFIDSPVQSYSSGMVVRLGFSIATALRPDILLIDEVLAVGDARFVWKCLHRIKTLIARGVSIILVSHDTGNLMRTCTTGLVLRNGTPAFYGALNNAILSYQKGNPEESAGKLSSIDLSSPIRIHKVEFVVDGRPSTSYSGNQELSVQVHVELIHALPQLRFVIGLFHGEHGALFHISSYKDGGWIRLGAGRHVISMAAGSLPLQFGTYYAEVNARGPSVADFYTARRSDGAIYVSEPEPNYEGFGVNGVLLPSCTWSILHE